MDGTVLAVILLSTWTATVHAGKYCVTKEYPTYYELTYCRYGCCGDFPNEECCAPYTWIIVLGVSGSAIFVGCIIAFICCCIQHHNRHRIQIAAQTPVVATVAYTQSTPGVQTHFYQQPQTAMAPNQALYPPPYQQPGFSANQQPAYLPDQPQAYSHPTKQV